MGVKLLKLLFILPLICLPLKVSASNETGGIENIFSYGVGLRAIGMGGAFTAMSDDATLGYWNPGAMSFNQYKEVSVFGTRTIADTYYFAGFYTHPTMNFGTLGIGGIGLYTGAIQSYDEEAFPIAGRGTDYFHYQVLLSYGYNFPFGLGIGGSAKIEQMTITDYRGTGASFDLGAYYNPPQLKWLSVGLTVQDVIGTGIRVASELEHNTRIFKLGVSTNFLLGENEKTRLSFALDSRLYTDNYNPDANQFLYDFSLGSEISFNDFIMLRAGYRNFTPESIFQNLPAGLSVGFGIRQWGITLDYAVSFEDSAWQEAAELLMQLGLSYRFGKSIDERKALEAEKIRNQIQAGIREATEKYEDKLTKLSQEYERERENLVLKMDEEYKKRVAALDDTIEEKRQDIIADLTAQFEAEKEKSLEELSSQYDRDRAVIERQLLVDRASYEQRIEQMESQFEEEKIRIREKLEADESFKSDHYSKGLQLFADGRYKEALKEFETVSEYDESYLRVQHYIKRSRAEMRDVSSFSPEILNFYYKGVDLFVQKKYEEAIREWEKILEIDPYNKLAIRNIKEAEDRLRKLKELGAE